MAASDDTCNCCVLPSLPRAGAAQPSLHPICGAVVRAPLAKRARPSCKPLLEAPKHKADSTLRSSRAVPHPSTNQALRRLTSEVRRDPVCSTRYGRQRRHMQLLCLALPAARWRSTAQPSPRCWAVVRAPLAKRARPSCNPLLEAPKHKADSTLRSSRAVPHPSTNRALCRLTSEVRRDPVCSTRYGRQRRHMQLACPPLRPGAGAHGRREAVVCCRPAACNIRVSMC